MIKEYIETQAKNNLDELSVLQEKLKKLKNELSCTQDLQLTYQESNKEDNTIFSPRSYDERQETDKENTNNKIVELNRQIEEVKSQIEACEEKNVEYEKMLLEFRLMEKSKKQDISINSSMDGEKIKVLLNNIYKKSEVCLAFLNSNKNKCKTELLEIKQMIKKFAEEINQGSDT